MRITHATRVVLVIAATTILAACAGTELEDSHGMSPTGGAFNAGLYEGYLDRSQHEYDYGDYESSDLFALRARQAANGETFMPLALSGEPTSSLEGGRIIDTKMPAIGNARRDLVAVLNGTARTRAPSAAADAQVMFDCWVEESQPDHIADCRKRFNAALNNAQKSVTPARAEPAPEPEPEPMEPERITVYFGFDDATVRPGEDGKVADAAAMYEGNMDLGFSVTGHADRAGPTEYNRDLSLQRARGVRDALVARGVAPNDISVAARGESEPAVPTPDGVREQRNRRVEILVQ